MLLLLLVREVEECYCNAESFHMSLLSVEPTLPSSVSLTDISIN